MLEYAQTIVYVEDVPKTVAFYREAFSFEVSFASEDGLYAALETRGSRDAVLPLLMQNLSKKLCSKPHVPLRVPKTVPGG